MTYDATDNEYLVAWYGDIGAEIEVCGQRVDADGTQIGGDVRLSNMGPDDDATRAGFFPSLAWNSTANEYLATWYGDGLVTDDEFEVFARRVGPDQPCASGVTRGPPNLTSVGQSSRRLTASWTLPSGMSSIAIEAATSPATDAEGFFTQGVVISDQELSSSATSYQSGAQLPPGTYYVHVGAYNPAAPNCADPYSVACTWEFSATSTVTIPADPAPPIFTATDPSSPSNVNGPRVKGSTQAGSTVSIFANSNCTGNAIGIGSAAEFGSSWDSGVGR